MRNNWKQLEVANTPALGTKQISAGVTYSQHFF